MNENLMNSVMATWVSMYFSKHGSQSRVAHADWEPEWKLLASSQNDHG